MAKQRLTDRIITNNVSLTDLVHIVKTGDTSQNPAGSSYATTIQNVVDTLSASTVTGLTFDNFTYDLTLSLDNGVTFNSNLSILASDIKVTGGTYNPSLGEITFVNNSGGTFVVSGISSNFLSLTGGTVTGPTNFTNGLSGNSISATTLFVNGVQITGDTYVTGGTYSNGNLLFTDNQNNTFQVTGLTQPFSGGSGNCITDLYVTNLYGCSPINVNDETIFNQNLTAQTITITTGQKIKGGGSNVTIDLSDPFGSTPNTFSVVTDGGTYGTDSAWLFGNETFGLEFGYTVQPFNAIGFGAYASGVSPGAFNAKDVTVIDNRVANSNSGNVDKLSVFVGTRNSTSLSGVTNSVIIGGNGVIASNNNTAYVDNLNIKTIGSGTSVINLGLDVNGNVVSGTTGGSTFTGGTVNGSTIFTNGLTANSLTVNGVQITGDTYVTGGTYSNGTLTFTDNQNNTFQVTGVTSSGGSGTFTGNTSASCITDLYITNLHGCSPITVHDEVQSIGSTSTGVLSFSFGDGVTATGDYSHAEGWQTQSIGDYSHAEGYGNLSSGYASHSEGGAYFDPETGLISLPNSATSYSSHAEGVLTLASGRVSHAEGWNSVASGFWSHSEGRDTIASSIGSHAEGLLSVASGQYSHAEGRSTTASTSYSHAEGEYTLSSNFASHSEGFGTTASGYYSHAEGYANIASGYASHAEGGAYYDPKSEFVSMPNTATTYSSHAEGVMTLASGVASHSEGEGTKATNYGSHAEGDKSIASGQYSHAEGRNCIADGIGSHAEGKETTAIGNFTHSEGYQTSATTLYSHAEGDTNLASGIGSHAEGRYTVASGDYSHAEGRETVTNGDYSHAEGYGTVTDGLYQHVQGLWNLTGDTTQGAFIIGNGFNNLNRSNLLFAAGNIVNISGKTITTNFQMTSGGTNGYVLTSDSNGNGSWQPSSGGGGSFGIFGISNSSGEYTYYSTLQSAIDNANFGDVIQMFSNVVESNSVTVNLKNGVDINMNGYSYILNGNNVNHCLSDNNVAVNCKIYNGNIVRSGATYVDDVKSLCLYVQNSGTIIETSGVYFENPTTTGINNNGTLKGAIVNAYTRGIVNKRKLYSVDVTATFETAIYCDAATSEVYDSIGRSLGGGYGIGMLMPSLGVGLLINSKGYAVGLSGILVGGLDKMLNCVGYSNSNNGIYAINTYAVENCSAYSNSAVAFYCSNVVAISNILGYSFSSFGVYLFSQGPTIYMTAQNVISESLTNVGCWLSTDPSSGGFLVVKNLQATSSLSGTAGVACRIGGNGVTILGGSLSVRNSSECLSAPVATTLKYAGLILKTSASPAISVNITQGITSSGDSQNNIIVV